MVAIYNIMNHDMVPGHDLVEGTDNELVLGKLNISREQLPKIRENDPAIEVLKEIKRQTLETIKKHNNEGKLTEEDLKNLFNEKSEEKTLADLVKKLGKSDLGSDSDKIDAKIKEKEAEYSGDWEGKIIKIVRKDKMTGNSPDDSPTGFFIVYRLVIRS